MIVTIEQHVDFIFNCLDFLTTSGFTTIEAEADAEAAWVAQCNSIAGETLFPTCNSWYLGANVPGKPRIFMPLSGASRFIRLSEEVRTTNYKDLPRFLIGHSAKSANMTSTVF